jgi:hypothetical protein
VICHEWGNDEIVITTNGHICGHIDIVYQLTKFMFYLWYMYSFTQIDIQHHFYTRWYSNCLNSNTSGVTNGIGTSYSTRSSKFTQELLILLDHLNSNTTGVTNGVGTSYWWLRSLHFISYSIYIEKIYDFDGPLFFY